MIGIGDEGKSTPEMVINVKIVMSVEDLMVTQSYMHITLCQSVEVAHIN